MTSSEVAYWVALNHIPGVGPITFQKVLSVFPSLRMFWHAKDTDIKNSTLPPSISKQLLLGRTAIEPDQLYTQYIQSGVTITTIAQENYPTLLKQIYDPPPVLYSRGSLTGASQPVVAVVGTRKMTHYGKIVTEKLVTELVGQGITIVSGLARGVDGTAHQATLAAGGKTIAVLGGGVNQVYPRENERLAQDIVENGGALVSEFPPDYPPVPGNFPARNRIISGLSLGVLVTEAAEKSGTMITVATALEQGRDVFSVPGPITSVLSVGTMNLIKQGAKLVTCGNDILEELSFSEQTGHESMPVSQKLEVIAAPMSREEAIIWDALANEAKHIDTLMRETGLDTAQLHATLTLMELSGLVKAGDNDFWYRS